MKKNKFAADALIFDVDGVLLDVSGSYHEVIRICVESCWRDFIGGEADCAGYNAEIQRVMKRHGGFNNDYDLAWVLVTMAAASGEKKLSRALPTPERLAEEISDFKEPASQWAVRKYGDRIPREKVHAICQNLYCDAENGLYRLEKSMISRHWKELGLPVGIYTGRDLVEWNLAKRTLGWQDFPEELVIFSGLGIEKPSPRGLEVLCERTGARNPVYFGDTASDMQAQSAFGKGYFAAIGSLLPEAEYRFDTTEEAVGEFTRGLLN